MIRPKVTLRGDNAKALQRVRDKLAASRQAYVSVGVHQDAGRYTDGEDVVKVALWNEFGTGKVPERSFLRSTVQVNEGLINDWRAEGLRNMLEKNWSVEKVLTMLGLRIQILVQNTIKSEVPPPNAPYTVQKKLEKGIAPRTLIETGLLLRSIGYKVFVKTQ